MLFRSCTCPSPAHPSPPPSHPQDDLLFAELTVYETLYFAARLRLPRDWPKADKVERVERVLRGLGLTKCRDTIVGNQMMRGVSGGCSPRMHDITHEEYLRTSSHTRSLTRPPPLHPHACIGGERKRVSIGHELLINPSLLLLDEPTSGLDSTTALKLIDTLHNLAQGGRTIITSIHQPASRLYQHMDKVGGWAGRGEEGARDLHAFCGQGTPAHGQGEARRLGVRGWEWEGGRTHNLLLSVTEVHHEVYAA